MNKSISEKLGIKPIEFDNEEKCNACTGSGYYCGGPCGGCDGTGMEETPSRKEERLDQSVRDLEKQRDELLETIKKIHDNIYEPDKVGVIIDRGMKNVTGLLFRDVKKRWKDELDKSRPSRPEDTQEQLDQYTGEHIQSLKATIKEQKATNLEMFKMLEETAHKLEEAEENYKEVSNALDMVIEERDHYADNEHKLERAVEVDGEC